MKKVIVNADDFGLTQSVNRGIVRAYMDGLVTSTTLMVNMPDTLHAIMLAQKYNLNDIGIHLNLTKGETILPKEKVYLLYDEKQNRLDIRKIKLTKEHLIQIEQELEAQIERFFAFGLMPTHLDSHHHIHMKSPIDEIVYKLAQKYRLPIRKHLYRNDFNNVIMPNGLDISFYNYKVSLEHLKNILINNQYEVLEIMTHPGYNSNELEEISIYNAKREEELTILTSPEIKEFVKQNDITLISFSHLKRMS